MDFSLETFMRYQHRNGPVAVGGEKKEAWELLAHYLHEMLKLTGIAEVEKNIRSLSIAMDSLNAVQVENLQAGMQRTGNPGRSVPNSSGL